MNRAGMKLSAAAGLLAVGAYFCDSFQPKQKDQSPQAETQQIPITTRTETPHVTPAPQELSDILDDLENPQDHVIHCPDDQSPVIDIASSLDFNPIAPDTDIKGWRITWAPSTLKIDETPYHGYIYQSSLNGDTSTFKHHAELDRTCPEGHPYKHIVTATLVPSGDEKPTVKRQTACTEHDLWGQAAEFPHFLNIEAAQALCERTTEQIK